MLLGRRRKRPDPIDQSLTELRVFRHPAHGGGEGLNIAGGNLQASVPHPLAERADVRDDGREPEFETLGQPQAKGLETEDRKDPRIQLRPSEIFGAESSVEHDRQAVGFPIQTRLELFGRHRSEQVQFDRY